MIIHSSQIGYGDYAIKGLVNYYREEGAIK